MSGSDEEKKFCMGLVKFKFCKNRFILTLTYFRRIINIAVTMKAFFAQWAACPETNLAASVAAYRSFVKFATLFVVLKNCA